MLASASRSRPMFSRQQSQRTTRREPASRDSAPDRPADGPMPTPSGFQPVSSQRGHDILGARASGLVLLVKVAAQAFGMPKLALGARLELPHALPGKVEGVADFLKRPRLVIAKPEALAHDLLLFPIEIADCARQVVEPALLD